MPESYANFLHPLFLNHTCFGNLLFVALQEPERSHLYLWKKGFIPVVPPKKNRKGPWDYDKELYKRRNEDGRYFLRLKRFCKDCNCYNKVDVIMFAIIFDVVFM